MRKVPFKNYIILGIIFLVVIFLLYYINAWSKTIKKEQFNVSVIAGVLNTVKYNELDTYILDSSDTIVYTGIVGNKAIKRFEDKFKDIILRYDLSDKMIHLDISSIYEDKNMRQNALRKYNVNGESIVSVPNIMVYRDGKLYDIYNIKDNDYDINGVVSYLKENNVVWDNND